MTNNNKKVIVLHVILWQKAAQLQGRDNEG